VNDDSDQWSPRLNTGKTSMADDFPNDLFPDAEIPLKAQIECVEREIKFRNRVYARRVSSGHMTKLFAKRQIRLMEAVLKTLKELHNADL